MAAGMTAAATREQRAWAWAYVAAISVPFVLMAVSPYGEPPVATFAVALGFAAFAGMALQVALAARAPSITRSVGVGALTTVHRHVGMTLVAFVVAHVVILVIANPWSLHWLWPFTDSGPAQWGGTLGLVAMLGLGITSTWRRRLGLSYEAWRLVHVALTIVAIGGAYVHVLVASDFAWSSPLRWYATLLAVGAAALLVYLRVGRAFTALANPYVVVGVRHERGDATTFTLRATDGRRVSVRPAQVAWLKFHGRPYSLAEHPFTIASPAGVTDTLEVTVKASGDTTRALRDVPVGTDVLVDGPHGGCEPAPNTRGWLLVVGGIGVTPAMSVLRSIVASGSGAPVQLVYCVRSWADATFHEELAWLAAQGALDLRVFESDASTAAPATGDAQPGVHRHRGRIDAQALAAVLPADRASRAALVCGPDGFEATAWHALVACGVRPDAVHAERFAST